MLCDLTQDRLLIEVAEKYPDGRRQEYCKTDNWRRAKADIVFRLFHNHNWNQKLAAEDHWHHKFLHFRFFLMWLKCPTKKVAIRKFISSWISELVMKGITYMTIYIWYDYYIRYYMTLQQIWESQPVTNDGFLFLYDLPTNWGVKTNHDWCPISCRWNSSVGLELRGENWVTGEVHLDCQGARNFRMRTARPLPSFAGFCITHLVLGERF